MFDEDNQEQALRMACETFLADYDGTPTLDNLDRTIATASVWEPLEGTPDEVLKGYIIDQYRVNLRELSIAIAREAQA